MHAWTNYLWQVSPEIFLNAPCSPYLKLDGQRAGRDASNVDEASNQHAQLRCDCNSLSRRIMVELYTVSIPGFVFRESGYQFILCSQSLCELLRFPAYFIKRLSIVFPAFIVRSWLAFGTSAIVGILHAHINYRNGLPTYGSPAQVSRDGGACRFLFFDNWDSVHLYHFSLLAELPETYQPTGVLCLMGKHIV